ncbi:MAG: hypothetical protein ACREDO_11730 [Methyloceanibacter sp.]
MNEGIDVVCTTDQGKQTISTTFSGDFKERYHATLKTHSTRRSAPSGIWASSSTANIWGPTAPVHDAG